MPYSIKIKTTPVVYIILVKLYNIRADYTAEYFISKFKCIKDNIDNKNNRLIEKSMCHIIWENCQHIQNITTNTCLAYKKEKKEYIQCKKPLMNPGGDYCTTCNTQSLKNKFKVSNYGRVDMPRAKYNFKKDEVFTRIRDWKGDALKESNDNHIKHLISKSNEEAKKNEIKEDKLEEDKLEGDKLEDKVPLICETQALSFMVNNNIVEENAEEENAEEENAEEENAADEIDEEVGDEIDDEIEDPFALKKLIYQGVVYYLHVNKDIYNRRNMVCVGSLEDNMIKFNENYSIIHNAYIIDEYQTNIIITNV